MGVNHFDRLSDDLLGVIFDRVVDANSLCCCICVSKRFASLVPQTKAVSVVISRLKQSKRYSTIWKKKKKKKNIVKNLVRKLIIKPLESLHHQLILICNNNNKYYYSSSSSFFDDSLYLVDRLLLKSFNNQIESLQIILPPTDRLCEFQFQFDPSQTSQSQSRRRRDSLLKWKVEFGSQFKSCVILSATSLEKKKNNNNNVNNNIVKVEEEEEEEEEDDDEESSNVGYFYEELPLLDETFSFIQAASMTHESLMSQIDIIANGPMLRRIEVVTDDEKQGRLCMNQQQIVELRSSDETTRWENRSRIPYVRIEFCYVPVLELPTTGKVMEGVSLILVRAVDGDELLEEEEGAFDYDFLEGAFNGDKEEEVLNEAVREMMKKTSLSVEE